MSMLSVDIVDLVISDDIDAYICVALAWHVMTPVTFTLS